MIALLIIASITADPLVATCYRRMNITLSKCMKSPGEFDMHLYDRVANTWVSVHSLGKRAGARVSRITASGTNIACSNHSV